MLRPKKSSYKEFDNEKKFLRLEISAFLAGHFLRLDRNRKPGMKSLWHPGYLELDVC